MTSISAYACTGCARARPLAIARAGRGAPVAERRRQQRAAAGMAGVGAPAITAPAAAAAAGHRGAAPRRAAARAAFGNAAAAPPSARPYTVRPGDTVSSICRKRGFDEKQVRVGRVGRDARARARACAVPRVPPARTHPSERLRPLKIPPACAGGGCCRGSTRAPTMMSAAPPKCCNRCTAGKGLGRVHRIAARRACRTPPAPTPRWLAPLGPRVNVCEPQKRERILASPPDRLRGARGARSRPRCASLAVAAS